MPRKTSTLTSYVSASIFLILAFRVRTFLLSASGLDPSGNAQPSLELATTAALVVAAGIWTLAAIRSIADDAARTLAGTLVALAIAWLGAGAVLGI